MAATYHKIRSQKYHEKLKQQLKKLPPVCGDFFRAISQTTSPLTRLAYAYDLNLFFRYLCSERVSFANSSPELMTIEDIEKISARDIEGFQEYLMYYVKDDEKEQSSSPTFVQNNELGIMRKLCSLRSFLDYLFKNELISSNVAMLVDLPKKKNKPILYLDNDEVQELIKVKTTGEGLSSKQKAYLNSTRERDLAEVLLFLGTGIRVSELVGLDMDDFNFEKNSFVVTRKGGDQSILYYPDEVKTAVNNYIETRKNIKAEPGSENALFLSLQKKRMTVRAVENMVKKYANIAAPLKKRISPHKLRSTFGTALYQETGDIYLVADALGHSDVNTTRRHYAAMTDQRKREAAKRIPMPNIPQENLQGTNKDKK